MSYYCDVCDKTIKLKSENKHSKSNNHREFDRCKHIKLTNESPNTNNIEEIFYAYIIEHNKKYDYYLKKCEFKRVFNDNQYCPYVKFELYSYKTWCFWYKFLQNVISDFKDEGYNFHHIAEKNIITKGTKVNMSYDCFMKHNMHAVERKIIMMINKDKTLII